MQDETRQRLEQIWKSVEELPSVKRLTPRGVAYVRAALFDGPSREVGRKSLFSNSGAIQATSRLEVGFESESGEATFVRLCELAATPLLLSQPPQITVFAQDARGRNQHRRQHPDFLRVTPDVARIVEVKPLGKLEVLRARYPNDWLVNDREWSYLPGVNAAQLMGMEYQVFYPELHSPQYRANISYLLETKKNVTREPPERLIRCVRDALEVRPRTIRELLQISTELNADHILGLIERGDLFGLLHHQTIGQDFLVYGTDSQRDRAQAEIESYRLSEVRPGSYVHRLASATESERRHAEACILRYKQRRDSGAKMNATDYRHLNGMNNAVAEGAPAIAGVVPRFSDRGGAGPSLPKEEASELREFLKEYLANVKKKPSPSEAHAELVRRNGGSTVGLPVVETVRKYLAKEFSPERAAALHGGPRAIQKARRITEGEHCIERVDAGGMWGHCDAVYSDVVPKDDEDWKLTRPIVFPLVMGPSLYIAAAGIMFGNPSALGFLMALRACIQDHGWLPVHICHDKGSELDNNAWKELAAHLKVNRQTRPSAFSRAGGEVESVNGAFNAYLQTLAGGTYHDQAGRDSDGKKKGRRTAVHDIQTIVREILCWIEDWNNTRHGNALRTPKEIFEEDLLAFPSSVVRVQLDDNARYLTSYPIEAKSFTYQRGLAFSGKKYGCDAVSKLIHNGETPKNLRLDTFDPSTIWATSSLGLVRLTSNDHHRLAGMCRIERIMAVAERMRYHIVSKRNQADYRLTLAKRRSDMEAMVSAKSDVDTAPAAPPIANKIPSNEKTRNSFAELAKLPRAGLQVIGDCANDAA